MIKTINMLDFLKIKEDINVIDIRNKEKYNDNHIPNSINIPYEELLLQPSKYLKKEETYYIYCMQGKTSFSVCNILNKVGYNLININGGYESYILNKGN